ncbi:ferritin family protein [Natranaerofaba carboxydovora]|uniref:ferritin family protein n=1 Tax=Natranaerofaba carboxydovora TaxID=2742683 RepID=UPI001F13A362|nr:ferritin family protein [Natranaerofaba carboxydovora]UMZ74775.1 Reverse rubrerythrin-2 [Natranaerofaba carboxydovora]
MQPFRCQICGETYLGEERPDRCPYCGVAGKHLINGAEWINHGQVDMSEQSYNYCQDAIKLELSNAAFYLCCSKSAENQFTEAIFKRLQKQEAEHAELICEMIGIEQPELPVENCAPSDAENFKEAHSREKRAMNYYLEIVNNSPEPRIKEVFKALAEVESEHLQASNVYG